jgi:hypothetical protein
MSRPSPRAGTSCRLDNRSRVISSEVLSIRPSRALGTIRAFVDLRIGDIVIPECKIVRQLGQQPWLVLVDRPWQGDDGKIHCGRLVELKSLHEQVTQVVPREWKTRQ